MCVFLFSNKHVAMCFYHQWRGEANKNPTDTFSFRIFTEQTLTCICCKINHITTSPSRSIAIAIEVSQWLAKTSLASEIKFHMKSTLERQWSEENIVQQKRHHLRGRIINFAILVQYYEAGSNNWSIETTQMDSFALMENPEIMHFPSFFVKTPWKRVQKFFAKHQTEKS